MYLVYAFTHHLNLSETLGTISRIQPSFLSLISIASIKIDINSKLEYKTFKALINAR